MPYEIDAVYNVVVFEPMNIVTCLSFIWVSQMTQLSLWIRMPFLFPYQIHWEQLRLSKFKKIVSNSIGTGILFKIFY